MSDGDRGAHGQASRSGLSKEDRLFFGGLFIVFVISALVMSVFGFYLHSISEISQNKAAYYCEHTKNCEIYKNNIASWATVATNNQVLVAFAQLVVSVVGLIGVGATVWYAHKAWREAEKSANAALDVVISSQKALEHSQSAAAEERASEKIRERAYMFLGVTKLTTRDDKVIDIGIGIENCGKSPGFLKKITFFCSDQEDHEGLSSKFFQIWNIDFVISGGSTWHMPDGQLVATTRHPFVYFVIEYHDIFGSSHYSRSIFLVKADLAAPISRFENTYWNAWD